MRYGGNTLQTGLDQPSEWLKAVECSPVGNIPQITSSSVVIDVVMIGDGWLTPGLYPENKKVLSTLSVRDPIRCIRK